MNSKVKKESLKNSFLQLPDVLGNIADLAPGNNFDKSWMEGLNQFEIDKVFTIIPPEGDIEDDGRVTYKFNSDGFRCDEFKKDHEGKLHVLFAGCSETEGVGSPLDTSWAKMFYDRIAYVNETSGYFNVGKAGWGFQKIVRAITQYVGKYGTPDYIFLLHPNINRLVEWSDELEYYVLHQYGSQADSESSFRHGTYGNITNYLTVKKHRDLFINFAYTMTFLEAYCEAIGTKLIWTCWETDVDHINIVNMGHLFKNFFELPNSDNLMEFIKRDRPDGKFKVDDLKRRDNHTGLLKCKWWGNAFADQARKKGLNVHPNFFVD